MRARAKYSRSFRPGQGGAAVSALVVLLGVACFLDFAYAGGGLRSHVRAPEGQPGHGADASEPGRKRKMPDLTIDTTFGENTVEEGPKTSDEDAPLEPVGKLRTPVIPVAPAVDPSSPLLLRRGNQYSKFTMKDLAKDRAEVYGMVVSDKRFDHYCTAMEGKPGFYEGLTATERIALGSTRKFAEFPYNGRSVRDMLRLHALNGARFTDTKSTSFGYMSQLMKTFNKFRRSWAYVCKLLRSPEQRSFIDVQLAGEPVFFTQFVWLLHHLKPLEAEADEAAVDELKDTAFLAILDMLQKQSVGDKIYLVSHGPDHGLRVMGQCAEMMTNPFFRKYSPLRERSLHDKFMMMVTCLLHDVGYGAMPDASVLSLPKWTHARFSHDLLQKYVVPSLAQIIPEKLINDGLSAIRNHNMDASIAKVRFMDKWPRGKSELPQCLENPSMQECRDAWQEEFPNLAALDVWPDAVWHREYIEAPIETLPFLFNVRVADNMDSFLDRLLPAQREYAGMLALEVMYRDPTLIAKADDMKKERITRDEYVDAVRARLAELTDESPDMMDVFAKSNVDNHHSTLSPLMVRKMVFDSRLDNDSVKSRFLNAGVKVVNELSRDKNMQTIEMTAKSAQQDFLHMYSVWIVREFNWDPTPHNAIPTLNVTFRKKSEQKQLQFTKYIGEAVYQIYRFAGSALTCMADGKALTDMVQVQLFVENDGYSLVKDGFAPGWENRSLDKFENNLKSPPEEYLSFPLRNLVVADKESQDIILADTESEEEKSLYKGLWRISTPQNGW